MAGKRWLYVFTSQRGRPQFAIFHADRPSPAMLRNLPPVIFADELVPGEAWMLDELAEEFYRRARAGEIDMTRTEA